MIVKKVKYDPDAKPKPKAWQIGDLVDYIRQPKNVNPEEKIEHSGSRNFLSKTHAGQKGEMIGLASESAHSKMPVTHWIFSWAEGEQPAAVQVDELADLFLEHMGLTGHQAIYGLHWNTENYHVHLAVNRMNPETGKVVRPHEGHDIEEAHKFLALLEKKQGWASEQNARYAVNESGEITRKTPQETGPKPKGKALDFETRTGEKSSQRIAQERGHGNIKNATTWTELHGKLAEAGLRFERKGSGAIVFVGEIAVKASSIDRAFSMKNLCKKLGAFEPGNYPTYTDTIAPEPVSSVNLEEWKTYCAECGEIRKAPPVPAGNPVLAAAKIRHKTEREELLRDWAGRGFAALNVSRHRLALWQKKELRRLRLEKKTPRRGGLPRFENWLRARGLTRQADRWRYRNRPMPESPPSFPAPPSGDLLAAYAAHREAIRKESAKVRARAFALSLFMGNAPQSSLPAPSRLDAQIALRLRAQGYIRADVAAAVRHCAPESSDGERRDWSRYAERTVAYAFGVAGDAELAKSNEAVRAQWRRIGGRTEGVVEDRPEESPAAPRMRMR
jgi:hypothetical protein